MSVTYIKHRVVENYPKNLTANYSEAKMASKPDPQTLFRNYPGTNLSALGYNTDAVNIPRIYSELVSLSLDTATSPVSSNKRL